MKKEEIEGKSIVDSDGRFTQIVDESEDKRYKCFKMESNGFFFTTILDKNTGEHYLKLDTDLAKLYGFNSVEEFMSDDKILDHFNKIKERTGKWELLKLEDNG